MNTYQNRLRRAQTAACIALAATALAAGAVLGKLPELPEDNDWTWPLIALGVWWVTALAAILFSLVALHSRP